MAQVRAIFQPVCQGDEHAKEVNDLARPWVERLLISSAYVNSAGVQAARPILSFNPAACKVFIGVRNGSSTAQGAYALMKLGVELYGVDTAMRTRIFHPKLYLGVGDGRANAIIGSANLTHAGMYNNIEAGARIDLDLDDADDLAFVDHFETGFAHLIQAHPAHCFRITTGRQIVGLMRQGLLEDERNPKTKAAMGISGQGPSATKPRIALPFTPPPKTKHARPKAPAIGLGPTISAMPHYGQLVWMKPNLPAGDLQLLTKGHGSGVLRLTQAGYQLNGQTIDQTTYFRYQVFAGLAWVPDPQNPGKVRAVVKVSLVIAGIYVGDFDLRLTHNPAWEAGQGNYTTGLHWDGALPHIQKQGLIGRTLRLFEPALPSGRFVVEID